MRLSSISVPQSLLILGVFSALLIGCNNVDPEYAALLFVHEVHPLLQEKCFACHGDDPSDIEGDFDIRTLEGVLAGGESGHPALIPGKPAQSPIYKAVTWEDPDFEMPPKENDRLTTEQIALLNTWIAGGAPWPDEARFSELKQTAWDYSDGVKVQTSGGLSENWTNRRYQPADLWAFQPVTQSEVPWNAIKRGNSANPVDAFVARKLSEAKLKTAARADRHTLIRRATFDLTGLPPTPEEIAAFVNDSSEDAFARVIERLLDSPRYGEQWGRHWLDVVRYADTNGYSNDYERPNAWRYRDYVIRAFNDDKPYDQFLTEQLAGDELDPKNPEMLVAAGFLRMGPWEHTGMSVAAETRQLFLDDVTNSVGETFLSLPLRCASCHDHKFDPIPTQDYYSIQSVFAPVQFAERPAPYMAVEDTSGFVSGRLRLQNKMAQTRLDQQRVAEKEERAAKEWMASRGFSYVIKSNRGKLPEHKKPPRFYGLTFQDLGYRKVLQKRVQLLSRQKDRYEALAFSVYNGALVDNRSSSRRMALPEDPGDTLQQVFILAGGSVHAPTDSVGPGVLSAVVTSEPSVLDQGSNNSSAIENAVQTEQRLIPEERDGRRLAFAKWLADPAHPITARSIVNRIWQYHFGQGIAGNANNFGVMGQKPSHPELLDWLATYFVDHGWSIKAMHRLIMLSDTYQRGSHHPQVKELEEKDPSNKLLAYFKPRRLAAEEMRDAMLFVSGELNMQMGGLPVKPEINMEVALQPRHLMGSVSPAYQPSPTPEERNRRTVYAYRFRGMPNPLLDVFNQPNADISCERRTASTVTPQAFTLFNSQNTYDRSLAFAARVMGEAESMPARIERAIELAWGRQATELEWSKSQDYVDRMVLYHQENLPQPVAYPVEVKREMFEEMTGESFEYTERLEVYENYTADLKPWEVDAETRALADLSKVLFNANEFVYVY